MFVAEFAWTGSVTSPLLSVAGLCITTLLTPLSASVAVTLISIVCVGLLVEILTSWVPLAGLNVGRFGIVISSLFILIVAVLSAVLSLTSRAWKVTSSWATLGPNPNAV